LGNPLLSQQKKEPTLVAGFATGSPQALFLLDKAIKSSLQINASTSIKTD
jgi:hypothetical protein